MMGVPTSTTCGGTVDMQYTASMVTQTIFTAGNPVIVTQIYGRPRVAGSGGACTLSFYKVPNGVAVASGTLLHSSSFNVAGTADTIQELTANLVTNLDSLTLQETDSIGYVLSGTPTSAVGHITICLEPLN
jgi:hypothetical protein